VPKIKYPSSILAALINLSLLVTEALGIYSTIDFNAYLLLASTIFGGGRAIYLVNSLDIIKPGSFVQSKGISTVEAGTQTLTILGRGTKRIVSALHRAVRSSYSDPEYRIVEIVGGVGPWS
jgi:hypothetical protein